MVKKSGIASGRIVVDGPVVAMENDDNTSLVDEGKEGKREKNSARVRTAH